MGAEKTILKILGTIFLIVGLVIASIAIVVGSMAYKSHRQTVQVTAQIQDVVQGDWVLLRYELDGVTYENVEADFTSSSYHPGDRITVRVDPANPRDVTVDWVWWMVIGILSFVGGGFILTGFLLFFALRGSHGNRKLRETGRRVYARVDRVEQNIYMTVNGRHPWVIYATVRGDYKGGDRLYRSPNLWEDPSPYFPAGTMVPVYYDERRPRRYFMDVESRMQMYGRHGEL